jgi:hypothetical protein
VRENEPLMDRFFWRNFPAEYLRRVPVVGELTYFDRNQGDRPANCLAVIKDEALWEYEMPNGRTYLLVQVLGGSARSVSRKNLAKKWRNACDFD